MKSLELYDTYLKQFFMDVNKPLDKITPNDIKVHLYYTQENRNLSNRTINSRRTIIHLFFEWCVNQGYLDKNPCRCVGKDKI